MTTRALAVGDLRARFGPGASLRDVTVAGVRVLDGVTFAVRDATWGTATTDILELDVDEDAEGAAIRFVCRQWSEETDVLWTGEYRAGPGRLSCSLSGVAVRDQWVSRAGFALLHPLGMRGIAVRAQTDAGAVNTVFPERIAPEVVLSGVRELAFELPSAPAMTVRFTGDDFETEDHRNWTDAGFKTYCTPLDRPAPRRLGAGERVVQSVEMTWRPGPPPLRAEASGPPTVVLGPPTAFRVPRIGSGASDAGAPAGALAERIAALGLSFVAVEVGAAEAARERLAAGAAEASALGLPLRVTAACHPSAVEATVATVAALPAAVEGLTLVDRATDAASPALLEEIAGLSALPFPVGSGTRGYFAELNRLRVPLGPAAGCAFSVSAGVHHSDDELVVDTVLAYPDVTRDALALAAGRPLHVGPVTLRQRLNVHEGSGISPAAGGAPGPDVDPRQHGPVAALLAIGAAGGFAGAATLELFRTSGPRGIVDGSGVPGLLERVLPIVTAAAGRRLRRVEPSPDRSLIVFAVEDGPVLIADRSGRDRTVLVRDGAAEHGIPLPAHGAAAIDLRVGFWYAV